MLLSPQMSSRLPSVSGHRSPDLLITLLSLTILIPICFWVFRDARKRYNGLGLPLLWVILVFLVLIVFLPLYLFIRPPKRRGSS
jgi:uncharacterized membrane protein